MTRIATLGPSVRLVVFQFHVKTQSVPEGIPKYSDFHKSTASQFEGSGVRIMEPTPNVLSEFVADSGYQLIDTWHATEEEDWNRSTVRFVFCHKKHLNPAGLRPDFVAQRDNFMKNFNNFSTRNMWQTMVHINPFFVAGKATNETVLMLDCNSRKELVKLVQVVVASVDTENFVTLVEEPVMVYQGGREKLGQGVFCPGIGPRIPLTDKANRLKLIGNEVVLMKPVSKPVPEKVSTPIPTPLTDEELYPGEEL